MTKIAEIIKYEGDNSTFIWKHPCEDFNSTTQLIVHESQEAIFFMNGQALDVFGPGRHTLETQNIPLIGKLLNRITGDKTPFHCEVYFINLTEQMSIKWGTDSQVQYMEPTYHFPLSIGASGEMTLKVANAKQLLLKLVGCEAVLGREKLVSYFRSFLMTRVKSYIAQTLSKADINIFSIEAHLQAISDALLGLLAPDFGEYGLTLERFFVMNVARPESDPIYRSFKELSFRQYKDVAQAQLDMQVDMINAQKEAQRTIIESQALATKRMQEGYTYQQERGFDVATQMARNEATGQFTNMGIGLGTMAGVGGAFAGVMSNSMQDAMSTSFAAPQAPTAPQAPAAAPAAPQAPAGDAAPAAPAEGGEAPKTCAFCPKCGTPATPGALFCFRCGNSLAL